MDILVSEICCAMSAPVNDYVDDDDDAFFWNVCKALTFVMA